MIGTTTATAGLVVSIPGCPDAALSPNGRRNPFAKARAVKAARTMAMISTHQALMAHRWNWDGPDERSPLGVDVVIRWAKGRKTMDHDNAIAACKATLDGVADGLGVNDKRFRIGTLVQDRDPSGRGEIIVTISEVTA